MPKKRLHVNVSLFAAMLLLTPAVARSTPSALRPQVESVSELEALLDVMSRVAGLYRDNALSFTCVERITDTRSRYRVRNRVAQRNDAPLRLLLRLREGACHRHHARR